MATSEHILLNSQQGKIGLYLKRISKLTLFWLFVLFYHKLIHRFADCSAPLTDLCRKSLPGRVVHCDATMAAFDTSKARMISAPVLLIPKSDQDAKFIVATDASKVGIA